MSEERKRVLQMVADGKVSVDEAERLLRALGENPSTAGAADESPTADGKPRLPRYMKVQVDGEKKVDVRIPLQLLRSGMKLGALLPEEARGKVDAALGEKGISLDLKGMAVEEIDEFLRQLSDFHVDVTGENETVRIYVE